MTQPGEQHPIPTTGASPPVGRGPNALIWRWWNLLLVLPLLMLLTPWFNKDKPRMLGLPFFYWYQLAFVFVGVACVTIVYSATKSRPTSSVPPPSPTTPEEQIGGRA
ncbi:Protein of unknown function [Nakamurella panacisegetis]|uniref:Uncharacterized protein n=1 Tax=Nakamurella panacisegetis TaxID=1090615 RepID=A0A1H0ILD0_9ACTN|nr:DUF3311 domain-containing protein [Nakamurella panacisegetis]SDO32289.1 Protein of unknown function [Nakamurella panacisegetis]